MTNEVTRKPAHPEDHGSVRSLRDRGSSIDDVELNSDESFPASDPPSWTPVARIGSPKPRPDNDSVRH